MKKMLVKTIVLGLALGYSVPSYAAITSGTYDVSGDISASAYVSATGNVVLNAIGDTNFILADDKSVLGLNANASNIVLNGNNHDLNFGPGGRLVNIPNTVTSNENSKVEILNAHNITVATDTTNSIYSVGSAIVNLEANNDINYKNTALSNPAISV